MFREAFIATKQVLPLKFAQGPVHPEKNDPPSVGVAVSMTDVTTV